jgi:hypothetical protein
VREQPALFDSDFGKAVRSGFDMESVLASQRRNIEAFVRASQCIADGTLRLAKRQVEIVGQAIERSSAALDELTKPDTPDVRLVKFAELAGVTSGKALTNAHELSDMSVGTITQTCVVINRRVLEAVKEFHEFAVNVAESPREIGADGAVLNEEVAVEITDSAEDAIATVPSSQPPFGTAQAPPENAVEAKEANVEVRSGREANQESEQPTPETAASQGAMPASPKRAIEPSEPLAPKSIPNAKRRGKKVPERRH